MRGLIKEASGCVQVSPRGMNLGTTCDLRPLSYLHCEKHLCLAANSLKGMGCQDSNKKKMENMDSMYIIRKVNK